MATESGFMLMLCILSCASHHSAFLGVLSIDQAWCEGLKSCGNVDMDGTCPWCDRNVASVIAPVTMTASGSGPAVTRPFVEMGVVVVRVWTVGWGGCKQMLELV